MPLSKIDSDSLSTPLTVPAGSAAAPAITTTGDTNTGIFFPAADTIAFSEGGAEAMRITSAGLVGIGTTSPIGDLTVSKAGAEGIEFIPASSAGACTTQYYNRSGAAYVSNAQNASVHSWLTSGTERARITSSGNLLVGVTSTGGGGGSIVSRSGDGAQVFQMQHTGSSDPYGTFINYLNSTPNGSGNNFIQCNDSAALRMSVRSNGGITNYSANDANLSDRREKTNFAPAKSYLDVICAIPVQTFNYIDQNMEEDGGLTLGVVAQDVQAVAPEMVMESNWGTQEDPKMRLSIYQTDLQYALMKSIQELKAIVDAQGAEIAALKGTP